MSAIAIALLFLVPPTLQPSGEGAGFGAGTTFGATSGLALVAGVDETYIVGKLVAGVHVVCAAFHSDGTQHVLAGNGRTVNVWGGDHLSRPISPFIGGLGARGFFVRLTYDEIRSESRCANRRSASPCSSVIDVSSFAATRGRWIFPLH